MMKPPAHKSGTAGQVVNPPEKTLKDYIDRKSKDYRKEVEDKMSEYDRGYQDGWHDAHVKIKAGE